MKRRDLFSVGGLAMAGLFWDPELLLWRPPQTYVFLSQRVSLAQVVAATYERVLGEAMARGKPLAWSDAAIIRFLTDQQLGYYPVHSDQHVTQRSKGLPQ